MKTTMKILAMTLLIACFAVNSFSRSNEGTFKIEKGKIGYTESLKNQNDGVRNSALLQIIKFKCRYPQVDIRSIERKITKMSQNDPNFVIRTNAHMTLSYLHNADLAALVNPNQYETPEKFFDALYVKMAENQLAMH